MNRLFLISLFLMLLSACGSADNFIEELENTSPIDSIFVIPHHPNDSSNVIPADTIIAGNDTTIASKDSLSNTSKPIANDTLSINSHPEIESIKLFQIKSESKNTNQGLAIYGNILFNCHHSNDYIDVYNLESKEKIASIQLEPEDIVHSNNVNFGSEFYSEDDKFPLLYIQQRGYASKLNVYRIICERDSLFSAEKIQTISFESCSWCINTIDNTRNLLYSFYGYKGKNYLSCFRMPSYREGDITIHPQSAIKTFISPYKKVGQDTAFDNIYLYILCGYSNEGELWRIDIDNKTAKVIDLVSNGLKKEPEGIDFFNGIIIMSFNDNNLYKIKIHE